MLKMSSILLVIISSLISVTCYNYNKFRVSFVLGAPASGKSTQSSKLVEEFNCVHLSAGDLLRKERESGSEVAELIEGYITQGAIVPVELTLRLIRTAMEETGAKRFLIDGFPRNNDNLDGWVSAMSECALVDSLFFLDCPESKCEERILKRAALSGRSDDNIVTLKKRFTTFKDITMPVVKYFENITPNSDVNWLNKNGVKVYKIDGDRHEDDVYRNVKNSYQEMIQSEILELSQELLDSIDNNNEEIYNKLVESRQECDNLNSNGIRKLSTITNAIVRVMGKSAIVSYIRLLQEDSRSIGGSIVTKSYEESRVWELCQKTWKNVNTHQVAIV